MMSLQSCGLRMLHWNVNGWTKNNSVIKSNIINHFQSTDIISINENHLNNDIDDQPTLPGFRWYGHCRQSQHRRANERHGGVGIFVNIDLYKYYVVSVIDQPFGGILALHFQHKSQTSSSYYFHAIYPQRTHHGVTIAPRSMVISLVKSIFITMWIVYLSVLTTMEEPEILKII